MSMGNERLVTYYYANHTFDVFGCWSNDTEDREFDFYDVFVDNEPDCCTYGEPFYEFPDYKNIVALYFHLLDSGYFKGKK